MKKVSLLLLLIISVFMLSACVDTRVVDMNGLIWKDDYFGIVATSSELQHQCYDRPEDVAEGSYYSSLILEGELRNCGISLSGKRFDLRLSNEESEESACFFDEKDALLYGSYTKPVKEKGKSYKYSLKIHLVHEGQYYAYCEEYGLEFPEYITLYGYEDKAQ